MRIALSFLTGLPVGAIQVDDYMAALGRSAWSFPLAGLVVGAVTLVLDLAAGILFGPAVRAVITVAAGLWVTGLLHLDGLMDTLDGVGSHRSRERMLEIMKDSRVGVMGAAGGALSLLLRAALLLQIPLAWHPAALLAAPALGRMVMVLAAGLWPPARAEAGLGTSFARHVGRGQMGGALLIGLGISLMAGLALPATGLSAPGGLAFRSLTAFAAALGTGLLAARSLAAKLGGLTGDTYGAVNEVTEWAVLACFGAAVQEGWPL